MSDGDAPKQPRVLTPEQRERRRRFYEYCQSKRTERKSAPARPLWENPYWCQEILSASPLECVVKLYEGAIQFLRRAESAAREGDITQRFEASQRAARIIEHLADTLDLKRGGEVAEKLDAIYKAALHRLVHVNTRNDPQAARDVIALLEPLSRSWGELSAQQAQNAARRAGRPLFPAEETAPDSAHPRQGISATV
jgi:flagellar protein FliS